MYIYCIYILGILRATWVKLPTSRPNAKVIGLEFLSGNRRKIGKTKKYVLFEIQLCGYSNCTEFNSVEYVVNLPIRGRKRH